MLMLITFLWLVTKQHINLKIIFYVLSIVSAVFLCMRIVKEFVLILIVLFPSFTVGASSLYCTSFL